MKVIQSSALVLGAAVALGACGATQTKTVTVSTPSTTTAHTTSTQATTTQAKTGTTTTKVVGGTKCTYAADGTLLRCAPVKKPGPPDCQTDGYTATGLKEGTCTQGGQIFTITNNDNSLKLKTLHIKLNGVRTADSLSDGTGQQATASGKFVILNLTIRNMLDSPQTFDQNQDQTALLLGRKTYTENFTAENGPDQQSCLWSNNNGSIQPDESMTCDVVYDVSATAIDAIGINGNFDVLNFGDSVTDSSVHTIGIIRTYHPTMPVG